MRRPWATAGPGRASRRRTQPHISAPAPLVWRAPEGPEGLAAVPVGGGGAWPGFETTRRAKLAARTASGRAAAHGHTKQPGPNRQRGARNTSGATSNQETQEPLNGIAKGAGISRPLARVPSLIHEGHLDATHQRGDDVVEHGSQRR